MLGQLHDAGNPTTLAHYLELLGGAGLLAGLSKFARGPARKKGSSPKLQVLNIGHLQRESGSNCIRLPVNARWYLFHKLPDRTKVGRGKTSGGQDTTAPLVGTFPISRVLRSDGRIDRAITVRRTLITVSGNLKNWRAFSARLQSFYTQCRELYGRLVLSAQRSAAPG